MPCHKITRLMSFPDFIYHLKNRACPSEYLETTEDLTMCIILPLAVSFLFLLLTVATLLEAIRGRAEPYHNMNPQAARRAVSQANPSKTRPKEIHYRVYSNYEVIPVIPGDDTCPICFMEKVWLMVLNPCGHMFCDNCSCKLHKCPMCKTRVQNFIKPLNMHVAWYKCETHEQLFSHKCHSIIYLCWVLVFTCLS